MSRLRRAIRFLKAVNEAADVIGAYCEADYAFDGGEFSGPAIAESMQRGLIKVAANNRVMHGELMIALQYDVYPDFIAEHDRAFGRAPRGDQDPLGTHHGRNE